MELNTQLNAKNLGVIVIGQSHICNLFILHYLLFIIVIIILSRWLVGLSTGRVCAQPETDLNRLSGQNFNLPPTGIVDWIWQIRPSTDDGWFG